MRYIVEFGRANTGMAPTFDKFIRLDTGFPVVPPAITEIAGTGAYQFEYTPPGLGASDIYFSIDSNNDALGAIGEDSRYRTGVLSPSDDYLDTKVSSVITAIATSQTDIDHLITAAKNSIKGVSDRDNSQTYDKVDAAQTALDASIISSRDSVKGGALLGKSNLEVFTRVGTAETNIRGPGPRNITEVYEKTPAVADLTALGSSIKGPLDISLTQAAGPQFDPLTDNLHQIKADAVPLARSQDIVDIKARTDNLPVDMAADFAAMNTIILRALGMLHENSVMDMCSYDPATNNLLSARFRIYGTRADAIAAKSAGDGSTYDTNKLGQYSIVSEYNGENLVNYMIIREFPA